MNTILKKYPYVENNLVYFNENMIVEQFMDIKWYGNGKAYYISKNYIFTKIGDVFTIDVRDLPKRSNRKLNVVCTRCRTKRNACFNNVWRHNSTKCKGCSSILDLEDKLFERLTVVEWLGTNDRNDAVWLCRCICGNMTEVTTDCLQSGHTRSCGCLHIDTSRKRIGDKNPAWNPNLTDEEREIGRNYPEIKNWSKDVKVRDNFTCQSCGEYSCKISSHHLNNYSDFPEQRLDLDNGVTLCVKCHYDFHTWVGNNRMPCTKDDFIRYLNEKYPSSLFLENYYKELE